MRAGKSIFIDTSRCTACRACQIACKNWHQNPAEETRQMGTYQNPADLSSKTWKLVRFKEVASAKGVAWHFFQDACRHCLEPPCKMVADGVAEGAIHIEPTTGAVWYDAEKTKKLGAEYVAMMCPYNIPRKALRTGSVAKCTMCVDRITNGLTPACVKACPTGTMNFGERADMMAMAKKRLAEVEAAGYAKAQLCDADDVRVIFLILDDPETYHEFAVASAESKRKVRYALNRATRRAARRAA
jgi:formate dehydrogenase iron-sulfur subunit